jgi:OOP family OmpA-OmpF porin
MKRIKRAIQAVALGACGAAFAPSVHAAPEPGFYIGLSVGESSFDIEKGELDDISVDAFLSNGASILSRASTFDDGDTVKQLVMGYRILPYIAIEGSYLDLGTASYRWNGNVNPPGPITSAPAALTVDVESKGFTVAGIGTIPIGPVFELHGKLGLFVADTDLSVSAQIGSGSPARDTEGFDSVSAFIGVGAGVHFAQHWSISADWVRYLNVGDENEDDDYDTEGGFDIDALTVSVAYKF